MGSAPTGCILNAELPRRETGGRPESAEWALLAAEDGRVVATRYVECDDDFLTSIQFASIRIGSRDLE